MKLKFSVALLFFTLFAAPLFAANGDLSFISKRGQNIQVIVMNFDAKSIVWKGRRGNGPWQVFHNYRITSLDSSSAYPKSRLSTIVNYDDGSANGNSFFLRNDLTLLQAGGTYFHIDTPLVFFFDNGSYKYKYEFQTNIQKGGYYTSTGEAWQKMSEFNILGVKYEGENFQGTPVFSLEFNKVAGGPINKLKISTQWDKMVGANNKWFFRK